MREPEGVRFYDEQAEQVVCLPAPLLLRVRVEGRWRELRIRSARGSIKDVEDGEEGAGLPLGWEGVEVVE